MAKIVWLALSAIYTAGYVVTVIVLTFFDGCEYTRWNWLVAIPVNFLLGAVWPIHWAVLRPLRLA
jgi:branched-subunit amino acid ABC-type transport system permease component